MADSTALRTAVRAMVEMWARGHGGQLPDDSELRALDSWYTRTVLTPRVAVADEVTEAEVSMALLADDRIGIAGFGAEGDIRFVKLYNRSEPSADPFAGAVLC